MSWAQVRAFDPKRMGTKKGWCLQNVRLGFGIKSGTFPSAKADMESQLQHKTLHTLDCIPVNCAVPVYLDTSSKYKHVVVDDEGTWWSDGVKTTAPKKSSVFGWGELCDGTRVVRWVDDKKPFLPAKGYWCYGDKDERVGILSTFMYKTFPAYTNKKALGTFYGNYLRSAIREFQKRTGLEPDGSTGKKTYAMLKKYGFNY